MVGYENWCVKLQLSGTRKERQNHPVIDYLNRTYRKNHDGSAYYYGVYNKDTFNSRELMQFLRQKQYYSIRKSFRRNF